MTVDEAVTAGHRDHSPDVGQHKRGKRGWQGTMMRSFGAVDHLVTVTGKENVAPHVVRVHMNSQTLWEDLSIGPSSFVRFWFPDGEGGEHQRGYTLIDPNPTSGDFACDFVLHEPAGPASRWAAKVQQGAQVECMVMSSRPFEPLVPDPAGYLLVGDSASLPAINQILEVIPPHVPVELYLEQHDANDPDLPVAQHPNCLTHWIPRESTESLAASIASRDWSDWYAWLAPEAGSLKSLRSTLAERFGFPKQAMYGRAYWSEGKAMGKDREATAPEEKSGSQKPSGSKPVLEEAPKGRWRAYGGSELLKPLKGTLWLSGVVQAIITLFELAPYVLLARLATQLASGDAWPELRGTIVAALLVVLAGALLGIALMFWLHLVDARFERELRSRLLVKFGRLPLSWFSARNSSKVKRLVQDDPLALHYLVTHAVPDAVAAVVAPVAVLTYLMFIQWRLALLLLVPVMVYIVVMYVMLVQSAERTPQATKWAEVMDGEAAAYIEAQPIVRIFGGSGRSTFTRRIGEYVRFLGDWQRPFSSKKALMDISTRPSTFLLLIVTFGTLLVTTGKMPPASLLPFLFLGTTFGSHLLGIGYGLGGLRGGMLAARSLKAELDQPELEVRPNRTAQVASEAPVISFEDVSFEYVQGVPVVDGINLTIRPGSVVALVGPSGSGKSTLAALIARFNDPSKGSIALDNTDLRDIEPDALYQSVGFVFQDAGLVRGTVRENLALAIPDATMEQVEKAAKAAQIHERIMQMPQGYETELGSNPPLSGGEKQRLAIARALLANTPILVLDEATAFADPESEYQVQRAINELTADRTVVIIAHRLQTIAGADQIVVLDQGKIIEQGTHERLLANNGRYARMWASSNRRDFDREAIND